MHSSWCGYWSHPSMKYYNLRAVHGFNFCSEHAVAGSSWNNWKQVIEVVTSFRHWQFQPLIIPDLISTLDYYDKHLNGRRAHVETETCIVVGACMVMGSVREGA